MTKRMAMKQAIILGAVLAVGAVSIVAGYQNAPAPPGSKVVMQTLSVRDILYVLTGGGSNTMALMRDEASGATTTLGVVLVDTKAPGMGQPVLDAIKSVTDQSVRTIINTAADADHVSGNVEFPTATQIIAHANTKTHMQKMDLFKGPNAKFLPNTIVTDTMSLLEGIDRIDLYYFGAGHTNGDLIVVFPEKNVAAVGDLVAPKAAPFIDTANGGSGVAFPQTLARAVAEIKGVNRVIVGHGSGIAANRTRSTNTGSQIFANPRTMNWNDLQEYADFNRDFLDAVQQAIKAGKSADEAAATLTLPERYKDYDMQRAKANVQAIYNELARR